MVECITHKNIIKVFNIKNYMIKLIDAFLFFNEVEILKFRLQYLSDVVDYFIICESNHTHSGKDKELIIPKIINSFPQKILDKIIYILVDDMPSGFTYNDDVARERYQRCSLDRGISKLNLNSDDILMISDIDEIPDKRKLKDLKSNGDFEVSNFELYNFCGSINNQVFSKDGTPEMWYSSKIIKYKFYNFLNFNPQTLRYYNHYRIDVPVTTIPKCGWHFSYFGGVSNIKIKLENIAEQVFNNDFIKNNIEQNLKNNKPVLGDVANTQSFTRPCDIEILDEEIINDKEFYTYLKMI
jgi:beta-1,4-mannosyl-glycoprotein beta-1,4-N-acetylglucosaminyltransferase